MNFDIALWLIGTFIICYVLVTLLNLCYRLCRDSLRSSSFDIQKFRLEVLPHIKWDVLDTDTSLMEELCDVVMKKFSDINSVVYEISDDASSIEFIIFTSDLKKYHVQIQREEQQ